MYEFKTITTALEFLRWSDETIGTDTDLTDNCVIIFEMTSSEAKLADAKCHELGGTII